MKSVADKWSGSEIKREAERHSYGSHSILKNPIHLGVVGYCFHPLHGTDDMPRENCQTCSTSNAMIDYSMVKCKLMEPRIGTGYILSLNEVNLKAPENTLKQ